MLICLNAATLLSSGAPRAAVRIRLSCSLPHLQIYQPLGLLPDVNSHRFYSPAVGLYAAGQHCPWPCKVSSPSSQHCRAESLRQSQLRGVAVFQHADPSIHCLPSRALTEELRYPSDWKKRLKGKVEASSTPFKISKSVIILVPFTGRCQSGGEKGMIFYHSRRCSWGRAASGLLPLPAHGSSACLQASLQECKEEFSRRWNPPVLHSGPNAKGDLPSKLCLFVPDRLSLFSLSRMKAIPEEITEYTQQRLHIKGLVP